MSNNVISLDIARLLKEFHIESVAPHDFLEENQHDLTRHKLNKVVPFRTKEEKEKVANI